MRRPLLVAALAVTSVLGVATMAVGTADAATKAKTYTVTRTFGPYDGAAKIGQAGSVPDGEALTLSCRTDHYPFGDNILKGSATVNRKTARGTTSKDVLTLDVIGAGFDPESDRLYWGAFVNATGKKGWNSVTLRVTCRK